MSSTIGCIQAALALPQHQLYPSLPSHLILQYRLLLLISFSLLEILAFGWHQLMEEREVHNTQALFLPKEAKKKKKQEFVLLPHNTVSTVFLPPHTENQGGGETSPPDCQSTWLTVFILSWINALTRNWALFSVRKSTNSNHYWPQEVIRSMHGTCLSCFTLKKNIPRCEYTAYCILPCMVLVSVPPWWLDTVLVCEENPTCVDTVL